MIQLALESYVRLSGLLFWHVYFSSFLFLTSMGNLLRKGLGWLCFDSWMISHVISGTEDDLFFGACIQILWDIDIICLVMSKTVTCAYKLYCSSFISMCKNPSTMTGLSLKLLVMFWKWLNNRYHIIMFVINVDWGVFLITTRAWFQLITLFPHCIWCAACFSSVKSTGHSC